MTIEIIRLMKINSKLLVIIKIDLAPGIRKTKNNARLNY